MKTPRHHRKDDEAEEEDDRKPPAKVILVEKTSDNGRRRPIENASMASGASYLTPVARSPTAFAPPTNNEKATANSSLNDSENVSLADLQNIVKWWLATIVVSICVFLYQVLPAAALATLLLMGLSSAMMLQSLIAASMRYYRYRVVPHGLGELLPSSLYRTLTQETIHEYMTDPSFSNEYRHLLLYYLPISSEQLHRSIDRLAPIHRNRLFQRGGIGRFLLGEDNLRLFLGETNYNEMYPPAIDVSSTNGVIETAHNNDHDDDDDSMDLGLDVTSDDMVGGEQGLVVARQLGFTPAAGSSSTLSTTAQRQRATQEDADLETQVILDAMWTAVMENVWNPFLSYILSAVRPSRRFMLGSTVSLVSAAGIYGWWAGFYRLPLPGRSSSRQHETFWWTTAILGGGTGFAVLFRRYRRRSIVEKEEPKKKR